MSTNSALDVLIPVFSLAKRRYDRVRNTVLSLQESRVAPRYVRIAVGGNRAEFNKVVSITHDLSGVHIMHKPTKAFNKCVLLNSAIEFSLNHGAEWIMCADVDNLYNPRFLSVCESHRAASKMLLKEIQMLHESTVIESNIKPWQFGSNYPYNKWGQKACGAIAYAHQSFWRSNRYDEQMSGMGYMDTYIVELAKKRGLEIDWLQGDGLLLHQHHKPITKNINQSHRQNSKIVEDLKRT